MMPTNLGCDGVRSSDYDSLACSHMRKKRINCPSQLFGDSENFFTSLHSMFPWLFLLKLCDGSVLGFLMWFFPALHPAASNSCRATHRAGTDVWLVGISNFVKGINHITL